MRNLTGPIVAAVIFLLLIILFPLNQNWIALLLMLGIIFYALFHNPMQHAHKGMDDGQEKPKRKLKK